MIRTRLLTILLVLVLGVTAKGAITDNLQAFYSLADVNDAHSTNHLTNVNTATFVSGKVGNCVDLELGSTQYLAIADNAAHSMADIDFMVWAWCKLESKPAAVMSAVAKFESGSNRREYMLSWNNTADRFQFVVSPDGTSTANGTVNADNLGAPALDTWYFVVAWHDAASNQVGIRVDNGTANTAAYSGGCSDRLGAFSIGSRSAGGLPWDGMIDEVGVKKSLLTSDEQTALYNGGSGFAYPFSSGSKLPIQIQHYSRKAIQQYLGLIKQTPFALAP